MVTADMRPRARVAWEENQAMMFTAAESHAMLVNHASVLQVQDSPTAIGVWYCTRRRANRRMSSLQANPHQRTQPLPARKSHGALLKRPGKVRLLWRVSPRVPRNGSHQRRWAATSEDYTNSLVGLGTKEQLPARVSGSLP